MQYKRILAVGDIHGMYKMLTSLMEQVQFNPEEDLLVFLGDYIDRGLQSLECLDYVMGLNIKYPERVVALKGNHEAMCINYYHYEGKSFGFMQEGDDMQSILVWLDNGGYETYKQFKTLKRAAFQKRLRWMQKLPACFRMDEYYFCHAGIQPYIPLEKQREKDLLWIRKWFYTMYSGKETIVVGHTPVQNFCDGQTTPQFMENNIIACDTGSFMDDGKLSCVDVLNRNFWQV
ncbi:MAG: serine/threonine protein phosphatase [Acidaminococcaceae bacterium]|nr:serine/threonine protein phosphatase [Acidaminococcaceae bacterium]